MSENVIQNKSFDFAIRIVKLYRTLIDTKKEFVLSKQILKSGTAIGALVREAEQAESKADFIHKLSIALKEASETEYWLQLLHKSDYIAKTEFEIIGLYLTELLKLLTSIIKTSKSKK